MADDGAGRSGGGFRLALSVLTRIPCRPGRTDREAAGRAMAWAPLIGAIVGGLGSAVYTVARLPLAAYSSRLLPASLALLTIAVVTGGLHLDGLADSADALGVRGDATAVRSAMKAPGVGAFGVVALILVVLVDAAALSLAGSNGFGVIAIVTGCVAGRLAATWSCRPGVAPATDTGLGAWVAGAVPIRRALASTLIAAAVVAGWAVLWRRHDPARTMAVAGAALFAALAVGEVVRRIVARHVGGLTGDVLGAVVECSTMAAYVVLALAG
jgi:adenosylcobinamide-GDP ribazoletransferase